MNAVDTNVLVYAYSDSEPAKRDIARGVLAALGGGVLPWQVACEFVAASRKTLSPGADPAIIWDRLAEIREVMSLTLPTDAVLARAKSLQLTNRVSFWDALVFGACIEAGVTRIYSEDLPGAAVPGLEIVNPFA